ncbi:MAG: hypothetical protein ACKO0Z_27475 [Betaproteobacteria bacterium]
MSALLIIAFAILFPVVHIANGWLFKFAEITPHISLIYLPAFLRLSNVLILGPRNGTLATMLGGVLLMRTFDDNSVAGLLNIGCSALGPIVALVVFKTYTHRNFELTSLKDLSVLTVIYAIANAVLHHLVWSVVDKSQLAEPIQVLWMVLGDIFGALIGAYAMKFSIKHYRLRQIAKDLGS